MLPYNRGRSPSPEPRGFWEAARSYHQRPTYDNQYLGTQDGPQGHEYHTLQRYDMRREYVQNQPYLMGRDPSLPINQRQRNLYTDHHNDNTEFYNSLAAFIKHKIRDNRDMENRDMASNHQTAYHEKFDRPSYHDVRARDYERHDDHPFLQPALGHDLSNGRGYDNHRDYADRQDFERRILSDHDRDRRRDCRDYACFENSNDRGVLGDHPEMHYSDRFSALNRDRLNGQLGNHPHHYDRGMDYRDRCSTPDVVLPRRNYGNIQRRSSFDRPSHLQHSPEERQRRPPTFRDPSNSRSLRGKVSPPQKRKSPRYKSNTKKQRQNERKPKASPAKIDEEKIQSLLTRKDLLERDIATPESMKTSVTQQPRRLRDLREEINKSRGSRHTSPEAHAVENLKQQDLRYDINKSRADRDNFPSGKSVVLRDQHVLRDSSPSTKVNSSVSQRKRDSETVKTKQAITIEKKLVDKEDNEALLSNDSCANSIRKVEFFGGESTSKFAATEAITSEKAQTNARENAARKTCETSIRKVQVCGGPLSPPSPRIVEKPPQALPCDDLRLLILTRRQKNNEDESDSAQRTPSKKQRKEDKKDATGTTERVVELSNPENNTNKAARNNDMQKEETTSSRTVKPPRRKRKNNNTKPNMATTTKKPVIRKVGLARAKSDNGNEKSSEQSKPCTERKDISKIPSKKDGNDIANSLNYSLISEDSNYSSSDEKGQNNSLSYSMISKDSNSTNSNEKEQNQSLNYSLISEDSNGLSNSDKKEQITKVNIPTTANLADDSIVEKSAQREIRHSELASAGDSNKASCLAEESKSTTWYSDEKSAEQSTSVICSAKDCRKIKPHPDATLPKENSFGVPEESATSESSDNISSSLSSSSTIDTSVTSSTSSDSKRDKSSESPSSFSSDTSTSKSSSSTSTDISTSSSSKLTEADDSTNAKPAKTQHITNLILDSDFKSNSAKNYKVTVLRNCTAFKKPNVLSPTATRPSVDLSDDFIPLSFTGNETLDGKEKLMVVESSNEYIFLQVDANVDAKKGDDCSIVKTLTGDCLPEKVLDISIYEADEALESPDKPEGCQGIADQRNISTTEETDPLNVSDQTGSHCSTLLSESLAKNSANMSESFVAQHSTNHSELIQAPKPANSHDLYDDSSNGSSSSSETTLSENHDARPDNLHDLCDDSTNDCSNLSEHDLADGLEALWHSSLHKSFDDSSNDSSGSNENLFAENHETEADYNHRIKESSVSSVPQDREHSLIEQYDPIVCSDNKPALSDDFSDTNLSDLFDVLSDESSNSSGTGVVNSRHTEDDNKEDLRFLSVKDNHRPSIDQSKAIYCNENKTALRNTVLDIKVRTIEVVDLTNENGKPNTTDRNVKGPPSTASCFEYIEITSSSDYETSPSQTSAEQSIQKDPGLEQYESSESDRFIPSDAQTSEENNSKPYYPVVVSPLQITSSGNDSETAKTIKLPDSGDMSLETPYSSESESERTITIEDPTSKFDARNVSGRKQFEYPIPKKIYVSISSSTDTESGNKTPSGSQSTPYDPENAFPLKILPSLRNAYDPEDSFPLHIVSSGNDSQTTKCMVSDSDDMSLETPCSETSDSHLTSSKIDHAQSKLLDCETNDPVTRCAFENTNIQHESVTCATIIVNSKSDYLEHTYKRLEQCRALLKDSCALHSNSHRSLITPSLMNANKPIECSVKKNANALESGECSLKITGSNLQKPYNKIDIGNNLDSSSSALVITSGSEADAEISTGFSSPGSLPKQSPCKKFGNMSTLEKCSEHRPVTSIVDSPPMNLLKPSQTVYQNRIKKRKVVKPVSDNAISQTDQLKKHKAQLLSSSTNPFRRSDLISDKRDSNLDEVYSPENFSPLVQTPSTDFSESSPEKPAKRGKALLPKKKCTKTLTSDFDEVYSPRSFFPYETHRSRKGKMQRTTSESSRRRRNPLQTKPADHRHSKDTFNVKKGLGSQHGYTSDVKQINTHSANLQAPKKYLKVTSNESTESSSVIIPQPCLEDDKMNELLLNEGQDLLELVLEESLRKKASSSQVQSEQNSKKELESTKQNNKTEAESSKLVLKLVDQKESSIDQGRHVLSIPQAPSVQQGVTDKLHDSIEESNQNKDPNKESYSNESFGHVLKLAQNYKKEKENNVFDESSITRNKYESKSPDNIDGGCRNAVIIAGTTESSKDSSVLADIASDDSNTCTDTLSDNPQTNSKLSNTTQTVIRSNIVQETPGSQNLNNVYSTCAKASENFKVCDDKVCSSTNAPVNESSKVLHISLDDYIDVQLITNTQNKDSSPLKHNILAPCTNSKSVPLLTLPIKKCLITSIRQLPDLDLPCLKSSPLKENPNIKAKELSSFSLKSVQSKGSTLAIADLLSTSESPCPKSVEPNDCPINVPKQVPRFDDNSAKSISSEGSPNSTAEQFASLESAISKPVPSNKSSISLSNTEQLCPKPFRKGSPSKEGRNALYKKSSYLEGFSPKSVLCAENTAKNSPTVKPEVAIATTSETKESVDERTNSSIADCHEKVMAILRKRVDVEKALNEEYLSALNAVKALAREKKATRKELQEMLQTGLTVVSQKYISELQSFVRFTTE